MQKAWQRVEIRQNGMYPLRGVNPILQNEKVHHLLYPSSSQGRESMHTSLCESKLLLDPKGLECLN